jgi:hypothetical protein
VTALPCGKHPACLLDPAENSRRRSLDLPLVCEDTVICPRHFWGFAVPIEVPAQRVDGLEGHAPAPVQTQIAASKPVEVVAGFNPELRFHYRHRQQLDSIASLLGAKICLPPHPGRDALVDLLKESEPDVVYLFCHALAMLPGAAEDSTGPILDFGKGHQGVRDDVLAAADIRAGWNHAPLVFLNGCGTAGFSNCSPSEFIKKFIQGCRAGAVIGSEVTVWERLAETFAEEFLRAFLGNQSAGAALLQARRELLAKNNPLGLVYTLYGSADLKLVH